MQTALTEDNTTKMNLYQKIQKIRVELQKLKLKKSGVNKYAGFNYYELGDFLPALNKLADEYGVVNCISFDNEFATLIIYDVDTEKNLKFTSPMRELDLKGCNAIQALGGVETYSRRYLYLTAYEIVENDMSDAVSGKEMSKTQKQQSSGLVTYLEKVLNDAEKQSVLNKYRVDKLDQLSAKVLNALAARKQEIIEREADAC